MKKTEKHKISEIGQINLNVKDVQKAVTFYQEGLGLPLMFAMENMAFFNCNGVRLMLSVPENESFDQRGSVIYFKTDDIHQTYEQFKEDDVSFIDAPHMIADMGDYELWMCFFRDLDDNTLALMSEIKK
ncbi:VOC family protein [Bacillus sp. Marseille-Q3570]|uniref:VOC family protein n=1 Tax=Bacillus sp. Marseille-Q3570 TaxID=2963522 RepID=UPI0021B7B6FD|nr:VOC family protein [Bacillus sp. Marseille-Q3570]